MKKLIWIVTLAFSFVCLSSLSATELIPTTHGTQLFHLSGALDVPLGTSFSETPSVPTYKSYVGGVFGLGWEYYLTENISTGVDLSYSFSKAHDKRFLNMISLGATFAWKPHAQKVEFPLMAELGMTLSAKGEQTFIGPHMRFGAAAMFPIDYRWMLGPSLQYRFIPEIYGKNPAGHTAIWHQLEIGLIAQIRL